ncbi:MAG: pilus assembly PilX family protein [Thermodesulfobacteriota bacterium]
MACTIQELQNQKGSVMALVLMIMVTILIVGIVATHDATIEGRIARNYTIRKVNFYRAEGAIREVQQILDEERDEDNLVPPDATVPSPAAWLGDKDALDVETDAVLDNFSTYAAVSTQIPAGGFAAMQYIAMYDGIAQESELGLEEETHLFAYILYGRGATVDNRQCIIRTGYRKRF